MYIVEVISNQSKVRIVNVNTLGRYGPSQQNVAFTTFLVIILFLVIIKKLRSGLLIG